MLLCLRTRPRTYLYLFAILFSTDCHTTLLYTNSITTIFRSIIFSASLTSLLVSLISIYHILPPSTYVSFLYIFVYTSSYSYLPRSCLLFLSLLHCYVRESVSTQSQHPLIYFNCNLASLICISSPFLHSWLSTFGFLTFNSKTFSSLHKL